MVWLIKLPGLLLALYLLYAGSNTLLHCIYLLFMEEIKQGSFGPGEYLCITGFADCSEYSAGIAPFTGMLSIYHQYSIRNHVDRGGLMQTGQDTVESSGGGHRSTFFDLQNEIGQSIVTVKASSGEFYASHRFSDREFTSTGSLLTQYERTHSLGSLKAIYVGERVKVIGKLAREGNKVFMTGSNILEPLLVSNLNKSELLARLLVGAAMIAGSFVLSASVLSLKDLPV